MSNFNRLTVPAALEMARKEISSRQRQYATRGITPVRLAFSLLRGGDPTPHACAYTFRQWAERSEDHSPGAIWFRMRKTAWMPVSGPPHAVPV